MSVALGTSIVWVTQFLSEALASPRMAAIEQGTLCFDGTPEEFLRRKNVQDVLGIENVEKFMAQAHDARASRNGGSSDMFG